ncbi:MAG: cytochrome c4 [Gammaproteobacteria bacterium]|jgi:cytochrome c553|nr:cytochrome c4 [Gammaproteobacteria bacterium]
MKKMFVSMLALSGLMFAAATAQAESLVQGSIEAGKAKSITCNACHGADGNSLNAVWPNLAGQNAPYIQAQLMAFKNGVRNNALMSSQAMMLSDEDMADLAVYYESLPGAVQSVADEKLLVRGEALYRGGDKEKGIAACLACHGPTGRGNPAAKYPALNGQHAAYTALQLNAYADGSRVGAGKVQIMQDIASRLDAEDIEALASYVQGLK